MANNEKHIVRHWRGKRTDYEFLASRGALDSWTRYSVIDEDKTITEYFGGNQIFYQTGQLLPVNTIVGSVNEITDPKPYDRFLVGTDETGYIVHEYFLDSGNNLTMRTQPFDERFGVRVKDRWLMNFVYADGKLVTYDEIDCGHF